MPARKKAEKSHPGVSGLARTAMTAMVSASVIFGGPQAQGRTHKPPLYGQHWMAVTGKPIAAAVGAKILERGGNAVDAACAMIAATATAWTTLSWGGETQALIYNPHTSKVIGINGLGVAPTGATPEYFHKLGMRYPPEYGPLAAVTPGTPGGLMTMLAEYGTMSLGQVLEPAIEMADGFAIDSALVNTIEHYKELIKQWPDSRRVMLPHLGAGHGDAAGAQHPRGLRSQVHGLRQRPLHPHPLPGDEPRLRRPRFLLRRPELLAGAADRGPAVEGLRARAREAHPPGPQRPGHPARGPLSVPGRKEPVPQVSGSLALEDAGAASHRARRARSHVPSGHDQRGGGG